ncbi:outer membrane-stress sensor serine endopeptidase DegS [Serratia marcescens]|uniref:S1C family serine protease n=1 Tax=Serratia TaxID=613 RepID=UPI001B3C5963|nr:trypsin-like peptidase domain-containing protein [Serratia surfactantfaciens]BEM88681.1 outer membrane-stress sensor serine endopeptidase DegS [Serratia marcescens]
MNKKVIHMLIGVFIGAVVSTLYFKQFANQNRQNVNELSLSMAIERALPSVVYIYSKDCNDVVYGCPLGTGVIMDNRGHVVTNYHVVNGVKNMVALLSDATVREAIVVGYDKLTDLAVMKLDPVATTPIRIDEEKKIKVGDFVLAIGNPYNLVGSVSHGIVSAIGRSGFGVIGRQTFIQTDAPINKGNSGGPLVNASGEMIGMNTSVFSVDQDLNSVKGISFALPVRLVNKVMKKIVADGRVIRGCIGVEAANVSAIHGKLGGRYNVLVTGVKHSGAASDAGLQEGDIINKVAGKVIDNAQEALNIFAETPPGQHVEVTVERKGKNRVSSLKVEDCDNE